MGMSRYRGEYVDHSQPYQGAFEITPHDSSPLPQLTDALYVGKPGTLRVEMESGGIVTLNVTNAKDLVVRVSVRRVFDTGTTASDIVGLLL